MAAALVMMAAPGMAAASSATPFEAFPTFDWANGDECTPAPEHPRPVLLVHGTWANAESMATLGRALADRGHCVFAVDYGRHDASLPGLFPGTHGLGDLDASAGEVHRAIRHVAGGTRAGAGAGAIDVVGHSQGAAVLKLAMNDHGDAGMVHTAVYLAGTHHGTTMGGIDALGVHGSSGAVAVGDVLLGPSALQQVVGSAQVAHLRSLPDTQPGVNYVSLVSDDDTTVTPPRGGFIQAGPGATVTNAAVQDVCPDVARPLTHDGIRDQPVGAELVADALAGREVTCG